MPKIKLSRVDYLDLKQYINVGLHDSFEVLQTLQRDFDLKRIEVENIVGHFYDVMVLGNLSFDTDLSENDYSIEVYELMKNKKSAIPYKDFDSFCDRFCKLPIYIAIEKNSGFLVSNSNAIELKIAVEKGISESDYNNNTQEFFNYLQCYKDYVDLFRLKVNVQ